MDAKTLLAWNLRRLRVARGISQGNLANEADVERAYVGLLENSKGNPTIAILEKLANVLDARISEFFAEPDPAAPPPAPLRRGRKKSSK